jgi:hypothetical protein
VCVCVCVCLEAFDGLRLFLFYILSEAPEAFELNSCHTLSLSLTHLLTYLLTHNTLNVDLSGCSPPGVALSEAFAITAPVHVRVWT